MKGIKEAIMQVRRGNPIGFFPAGAVSKINGKLRIEDREWQPSIIRLIQQLNVPVIPIYFHGHNSTWFNILGMIDWRLRTLRLPAEVWRKCHTEIHISVGDIISPEELKKYPEVESWGNSLKTKPINYVAAMNNIVDMSAEVREAKSRFGIVGNAPALVAAVQRALRVAPIDLSVLITGESGTGKEFFPQIIHAYGARKHSKYIAVNCGAIPEGTIDSELFGHEKGAFTGAIATRKGYFEEADGGTIFLDEVAELPLSTQARLLQSA